MVRDSRWGWMDSRVTGYLANISTQKRGKEPEFLDGKKQGKMDRVGPFYPQIKYEAWQHH